MNIRFDHKKPALNHIIVAARDGRGFEYTRTRQRPWDTITLQPLLGGLKVLGVLGTTAVVTLPNPDNITRSKQVHDFTPMR